MAGEQRCLRDGRVIAIGAARGVGGAVLREEGFGHVDAVQPHLVRICLLVPEATVSINGKLGEHVADDGRGGPVSRVVGILLRQEQQQDGGLDQIEAVLLALDRLGLGRVGVQVPGRVDEVVDVLLDVRQVAKVGGPLEDLQHAAQNDAVVVVPAAGRDRRCYGDPASGE